MAAIAVNNTHRKHAGRVRLKAWLAACREMLDGFVGERLKHSAMEAGSVRSRRRRERRGRLQQATGRAELPSVEFGPLAPDVVNETIPAFFIGRNNAGLWVAREATGRIGGVFLFEASALGFAHAQSRSAGCATIFPSQRFELDLENRGNPLAGHLTSLIRVLRGRA